MCVGCCSRRPHAARQTATRKSKSTADVCDSLPNEAAQVAGALGLSRVSFLGTPSPSHAGRGCCVRQAPALGVMAAAASGLPRRLPLRRWAWSPAAWLLAPTLLALCAAALPADAPVNVDLVEPGDNWLIISWQPGAAPNDCSFSSWEATLLVVFGQR